MLDQFVAFHRDEIIRRCREKVNARSIPLPTRAELDHGVPLFLDQLANALRLGEGSRAAIARSAMLHGHDLRRRGFTVSQVVHDYGDVCQAITELAVETDAPIDAGDFRMLNGCLDDAIAIAVTQFAREGYQAAVDEENARGGERLGFLAHELRNLLNTAVLAFDVLKTGNVGVAGSTGAILHRSLVVASDLIARSLAEVRLAQGVHKPERFEVAPFIDEVATASKLAAEARRIELIVAPVAAGLAIEADRQLLSAVVTNLLQNAFKFTRPETAVSLRVDASAERVLIEIQDACGGLPAGDVEGIFRPFEQRNEDRSGLGLGLAFSRWGIKASHGRLYARDLPTVGCVFTVDLPRLPAPAVALS